MSVFDKWDKAIDTEGLANDVAEAEKNGGTGDYPEVPVGQYEIRIEKMELKESSKGDPMFSAWFKIISGDHENQYLFMNSVITQGFQIGNVNKFLRSLDAVDESTIEFRNYGQYNNLIMDIMEAVEDQGLEYLIDYRKGKKDFPVYTIKDVFES